jgi:hypothetical protein
MKISKEKSSCKRFFKKPMKSLRKAQCEKLEIEKVHMEI